MVSQSDQNVYIVIPVHNRKATTLSCLDNLEQIGVLSQYSVIVIDDGSTDGTEEAVIAMYPSVSLLKGTGDLWWTGAIRIGMEYAAHANAEYIFWLNDDCQITKDTVSILIEFMQENPNTVAAPQCLAELSNISIENGCIQRTRKTANSGEFAFVESLSGYCVGIPRSVFESIGFPNDKKFPHYAGDDTYILRATRRGFKACIVGNAKVILKSISETEYSFGSYLRERFSTSPNIHDVFFKKKSRYYLYSQFHYYLEKYTFIIGFSLFTTKTAMWLTEYFWISITHQLNHASSHRS